jgi:leucyl-tRNA synthetase
MASWPEADDKALEQDMIEVVVQVNGKLRGRISVAFDADEDAVRQMALSDENVQRFIGDKEVRKVIIVPGRLVSVVV